MQRRHFLGAAGAATASGLLGGVSLPGLAAGDDYTALVIVYLNGGSDGNNMLVPTDAAYTDYMNARANLALSKASLTALSGSSAGHTFGLHPSLAPLAGLYNTQRLGFISNVGPLIKPATAAQVLAGTVPVPPFLLSHSDQTAIVQGWQVSEDASGWAGRGLEKLDAPLRTPLAAVTMDTNRTLVLGRQSPVTYMPAGGVQYWGQANLEYPDSSAAQAMQRMSRWQFANDYEAEQLTGLTLGRGPTLDRTAVEQAARALIALGVRAWAVVHFPEGVCACSGAGEICWQPSVRVPVAEIAGTAGAGDALASGILFGLHESWPMPRALELGVCAAAASLRSPTCSDSVESAAACLDLGRSHGFQSDGTH
jgi:hypothetical protein